MIDKQEKVGYELNGVEMIHTPLTFRSLRAEEVDVRPAQATNGKATLLLYQDARCAMNILDETVGNIGWQKEFYDAKGLLMCRIGIRDSLTGEWLWKSDTGSESNIEADKGLASDAFKRAAVSWGIGRELYTAPQIKVNLTDKDLYNGKLTQSFKVGSMSVEDGEITSLTILDKWGKERFSWNSTSGEKPQPYTSSTTSSPSSSKLSLRDFCSEKKKEEGIDIDNLVKFFNYYNKPSKDNPDITIEQSFKSFDAAKMWERWISPKS